jgi:hypothetical protein
MTLDYPAEKLRGGKVSPEEGRSHNTSDSSPSRVGHDSVPDLQSHQGIGDAECHGLQALPRDRNVLLLRRSAAASSEGEPTQSFHRSELAAGARCGAIGRW